MKKHDSEDDFLIKKYRQHVTNFLKILISIILIVWLFHRIGFENITLQLKAANWLWVGAGILIFMTSNILGSLQWYTLLRTQNVKLSFGHVVSYYHIGLFFNNFLIGYVGGDALRIYDVTRHSGDSTVAVSSVVFDRFIGFFTLTSIAMFVSLFQLHQLTSLKTVYFIGIVLFVWITAFFLLFNEKAGKTIGRLFKPFTPHFVAQKVHDVYMAINQFRHSRMVMLKIFGISILVQTLRIVTHYCAALAVGVNTSILYFFMFIPLVALFASLPISFGGIGVREQSGVTLFSTVGLVASKVVTFEFLAYIIGIVATIPGGVLFALRREDHFSSIKMETVQHTLKKSGGPHNE